MLLALLLLAASPDPAQAQLSQLQTRVERALANGALRRQFRLVTEGWQRARGTCGQQAACRANLIGRQSRYLSALAARISDANPTLADLQAKVLVGRLRAGDPVNLDASHAGHILEDATPAPGSIVDARPGTLCTPDCHDAGLEPGTLGTGASDETIRTALKLPADVPIWTVILDGKAGYRLLPAKGQMFVVSTSCDDGARTCWPTLIPLTPDGQTAFVTLTP